MTSPAQADFEQVRGWIQREAASKSVDEVHESVMARVKALVALVTTINAEQFAAIPTGDMWSPADLFKHVVEWNVQVGEDVLNVSLTGERPGNPLPDLAGDRDELVRKLRESLDSVYAHVSAADPDGFLDATWEHPFFGQLTWREWHFFLGVHAMDHTQQLQAMEAALNA